METLLFNSEKYERLYNCSFYDVNSLPIENRRHRFWGLFFLFLYSVCFFLYIVCMIAMLTMEQRKQASYQIMILLGVIHCIGLQTSGLFAGIWTFQGTVFCSSGSSTINYVVGCLAVSSWCASTMTSQILGLNRCFVLFNRNVADLVFGGWRLIFWLSLPLLYMTYMFGFTVPPVFTSILMSYLYDPHFYYFTDQTATYKNVSHIVNNLFVCLTESGIYGTLIVLYIRATRSESTEIRTAVIRDKRIYIQVLLVGFIHFIASLTYVLIQFFPAFQTEYVIVMASTFYLLSQGTPPLIYIFVNRTLRNQILHGCKITKAVVSRSTVSITPLKISSTQESSGRNRLPPIPSQNV
ncbi:hypothetical protein M3Y95_00316300 [Aphelenchoides besseyi]|nr:hypothetical protein M3Y95_00316300 [Aphelenchoides besseyi]